MEIICIFLLTMPSIGVFALPFSPERDLELVTDTSTEPLERLIAELDEKINSVLWSSNDSTSLDTFNIYLELRSKVRQIYWDQRQIYWDQILRVDGLSTPSPCPSTPSPCPLISDWDQKRLSTQMAAYKKSVSIYYFLVGVTIFLICLSIELMLGLPFIEDNRSMKWKIISVALPVVVIIILYWLVTAIHQFHFPQFYEM